MMYAIHALSTEINVVKMRIEEIHCQSQGEMAAARSMFRSQLDRIHSSLKRITIQPVVRSTIQTDSASYVRACGLADKALFSKRPSDLYQLWKEYEFGLGGNKPAKHFTDTERGAQKIVYCFRLKFWCLVEALLKRGHASNTAIDAIYAKYGRSSSVTTILNLLRKLKPMTNEFG
ncbi:hypothetical protein AeMF1_010682 [Aphanomyces euteiches]|nr:hypothetical protein AeMF1_010682 [Aphanomyces euteiches]KAH9184241.1 hypothetical protein AeNC1_013783 [Aphanomyces euteiches]